MGVIDDPDEPTPAGTTLKVPPRAGLFLCPNRSHNVRAMVRYLSALALALLLPLVALADITGTARVIDGDTIEIAEEVADQRIRLRGNDAPESRQLCYRDGKPWRCGGDATRALAEMIGRHPVNCEELGRDRYKRIVAKCAVEVVDLGEWMVSQGWAVAYYLYSYEYSRAEQTAKSARRGI